MKKWKENTICVALKAKKAMTSSRWALSTPARPQILKMLLMMASQKVKPYKTYHDAGIAATAGISDHPGQGAEGEGSTKIAVCGTGTNDSGIGQQDAFWNTPPHTHTHKQRVTVSQMTEAWMTLMLGCHVQRCDTVAVSETACKPQHLAKTI